ncbi:MAG: hypothetical protein M1118_12985 [Chloroflexi bacterium]|nr:hypothetical protein [Chloroflexota bacterium]
MIQELSRLAARAALDPAFLAYHLQSYRLVTICQRLDCSLTTALLLLLSATPRLECWQHDRNHLARARGLSPQSLAALLEEAEAAVWQPAKTSHGV